MPRDESVSTRGSTLVDARQERPLSRILFFQTGSSESPFPRAMLRASTIPESLCQWAVRYYSFLIAASILLITIL